MLLVILTDDFWSEILFRINVIISNNVLRLSFHCVNREWLCKSYPYSRESSCYNENCVLSCTKLTFLTEFRILENGRRSRCLKYCKIILYVYADDTRTLIYYSAKWTQDVQSFPNKVLESASLWLLSNLLTLNVSKSRFLLFGSKAPSEVVRYCRHLHQQHSAWRSCLLQVPGCNTQWRSVLGWSR